MTRRRLDLASEQGMTMIAVVIVMLIATTIGSATLLAAQADLPFSKASQDRKQAYAAAEAGMEYYLYQLTQDNDYWSKCASVPAPAPVNQRWVSGAETRKWRPLTGTKAQYTIELMPAIGSTCTVGNAHNQMIDAASGTFKIRSTGRTGNITRSIVSSFRRRSFLDFLYFTDYETYSPLVYPEPGTNVGQQTWAENNCVKYRAQRHSSCTRIQFISDDANRGPFHTNDDILACGTYTLGRKKSDRIEISGPAKWVNPGTSASCQAGEPEVLGTVFHPADKLEMPDTNRELREVAGVIYQGRTTLYFHDGVMDVTNNLGVTTPNVAIPPNGVIYVDNLSCSTRKSPAIQDYKESAGCANVTVYGKYNKSITVASAKDIIIGSPVDPVTGDPLLASADLTKEGDVVMGLIADQFVRVSHAVRRNAGAENDPNTCVNRNATTSPNEPMKTITIEAAILSLRHSFIADNHLCGAELGTLNVKGAIAQRFRGPVGVTRGSGRSGFVKNYEYDDRLKYRSPPYFLDPVSAAWGIVRQNEQVPAATKAGS